MKQVGMLILALGVMICAPQLSRASDDAPLPTSDSCYSDYNAAVANCDRNLDLDMIIPEVIRDQCRSNNAGNPAWLAACQETYMNQVQFFIDKFLTCKNNAYETLVGCLMCVEM